MSSDNFSWKQNVNWQSNVKKVMNYYDARPKLKFGPKQLNKAFPLIDYLCQHESATQAELMQIFSLVMDDIMTILSNVTMAIQGNGKVWSPETGGWYTTETAPYT